MEERDLHIREAKAKAENDALRDREERKNETASLLANFSQLLAQTQLSHSQYVPQQALTQTFVTPTTKMHQSINQSKRNSTTVTFVIVNDIAPNR